MPLRAAIITLVGALVLSCASTPIVGPSSVDSKNFDESSDSTFWVLAINGGGSKRQNYQSHLLHVRRMLKILADHGIVGEHVAVFSSDGSDPEVDLAVRDVQKNADFWLIERLPVGNALGEKVRFENTVIDGTNVHPATKLALADWMDVSASKLRPGDTLLVYVTDHGVKNREDLTNNKITLWGEQWSVEEFRRFLDPLPRGVRVVTLMSQCYSGSFANVIYEQDGTIRRNVCGYFSSSAARPAYGCYPENLGKDNVGHSFRFLEALETHGNMQAAHRQVLIADGTPDVPNRTSDLFLRRMLESHAEENGQTLRNYVDVLLNSEPANRNMYPDLFRQIDAIARRFGASNPKTLSELLEISRELPRAARQLRVHARRWRVALDDLKRANLERFLAAHETWRPRLAPETVAKLDEADKRKRTRNLLAALARHTRADRDTAERLRNLRDTADQAAGAAYRMEVRHAAALRMQQLLVRIAGSIDLERSGNAKVRRVRNSLAACENLDLSAAESAEHASTVKPHRRFKPAHDRFPPLSEDVALLESIRPGWLGIEFAPVTDLARKRYGLARGAVTVRKVVSDSPAQAAGLAVDDIIVGPAGRAFRERNQIREWVMTTPAGSTRSLSVLRGGMSIKLDVRIGPTPL